MEYVREETPWQMERRVNTGEEIWANIPEKIPCVGWKEEGSLSWGTVFE